MSLNKAIIIGNVANDFELRKTSGGAEVVNFTVATNESWKDKSGEKHQRTEWHNIVVWGPQASACASHLRKGSQVYIEGRLQTRKWEDKNGQPRYTTEVQAADVKFLATTKRGDVADEAAENLGLLSNTSSEEDLPI